MQGKKNLRSKICSAALKFPIAACPQALCASLSRSAPSVTAAKPLRLRAPFSGPPGRKAVHSASCLSRLLPGAPRFSLVTLRSGQVARSLLRASLLSRCAGRPPPNERQPSARPVAYGCRELRGRPPSAFHIKRRPLLRASLLSRSACSRRAASLRLKQNPVPLRGPWAFAFAALHPPLWVYRRAIAAGRPPPNERQPSERPVAYGCCELRRRPPSAFRMKRGPFLRAVPFTLCSRLTARSLSLRLGLVSGPLPRPCARPRSAPSSLAAACSALYHSRLAYSRRAASLRLKQNPAPLRGSWAFAFAALHPRCSRRLGRYTVMCADSHT